MDSRTYGRLLGMMIVTAIALVSILIIGAIGLWIVRTISGAC